MMFLIIANVDAFLLDSGVQMNTTKSNTSMTFDSIPVIVDTPLIIRDIAIELWNISYVNGELIINSTILTNQTTENFNIDSSEFPFIVSSLDIGKIQTKEILSNLTNIINGSITFDVHSEPDKIQYLSNSSRFDKEFTKDDWTFNNAKKTLTLDINGLETGSLTITYNPTSTAPSGGGGSSRVKNITEKVKEIIEEIPTNKNLIIGLLIIATGIFIFIFIKRRKQTDEDEDILIGMYGEDK